MACDCECHDEPVRGLRDAVQPGQYAAPEQNDSGRFDCADATCTRDFGTAQGARVHYSRTHGTNADLDEPEPEPERVTLSGSAAADLGEPEPLTFDASRSGAPIHVELKFDLPLSDDARTALVAMLQGLTS